MYQAGPSCQWLTSVSPLQADLPYPERVKFYKEDVSSVIPVTVSQSHDEPTGVQASTACMSVRQQCLTSRPFHDFNSTPVDGWVQNMRAAGNQA